MLDVKICYRWRPNDVTFAENSVCNVIPMKLDKQKKDEIFTLIP